MWDIRRAGALMIFDSSNTYSASINEKFISPKDGLIRRDVTSHNGWVTHVMFSADGFTMYSLGMDNYLRCWNSQTGRHSFLHFPQIQSTARNTRFCIARDEYLFVPSGLTLNQYQASTGLLTNKFTGHFDRITCAVVNSKVGEVYSAGMDRAILVWTMEKQSQNDEQDEQANHPPLSPSVGPSESPLEMSLVHSTLAARLPNISRSAMEDGDNWSDED
jgi:WD40 repeat protein